MILPVLVCPHRPPCPGCPRLGLPDLEPRARAALDALARSRGLGALRMIGGPPTAFRHRARLAVRGRARSPKIGIFATGSHRVIDIPRCLVHHPLVNEIAAEARAAIRETGTPVYSDEVHLGLVRYLQVVVQRSPLLAQVVVVANAENPDSSRPLLAALGARLGERLHSLFWNGNPLRTNAILGEAWHRESGAEAVEERIGGARIFYTPGAFGQSHLELSNALVDAVHAAVPDGSRVVELYAGVGAIGLGLAHRVAELHVNEVAKESLRALTLGVAALDPVARARVHVVAGEASTATAPIEGADVVIVDPPRRGLDAGVLAALVRAPPRRLIYVACGLDTFLADELALEDSAGLRLTELSAYDMFPHTEHIETLAVFDRR
jgi:23S rRNA (uracil1939-C5)-methyltransferase